MAALSICSVTQAQGFAPDPSATVEIPGRRGGMVCLPILPLDEGNSAQACAYPAAATSRSSAPIRAARRS